MQEKSSVSPFSGGELTDSSLCYLHRLQATSALSPLSHISIMVFCSFSKTLNPHGENKPVSCALIKHFPVLPGLLPTFLQYCSSHLFSLIFSLASSVLRAKIMLVHTYTHTHTRTHAVI